MVGEHDVICRVWRFSAPRSLPENELVIATRY